MSSYTFMRHALDCEHLVSFDFELTQTLDDDWISVTVYRDGVPVTKGEGDDMQAALDDAERALHANIDAVYAAWYTRGIGVENDKTN